MKGDLTLKFLELINEAGVATIDLLEGFLSAGYGASSKSLEFHATRARARREKTKSNEVEKRRAIRQYYNLVAALKRDGLILVEKKGSNKSFFLTKKGASFADRLRNQKKRSLPSNHYESIESNVFVIATFDIPEKERTKRAWIRSALKNIGMSMIQQSVWAGKVRIPETFLLDLKKMNIAQYVQILSVNKEGSLRPVVK